MPNQTVYVCGDTHEDFSGLIHWACKETAGKNAEILIHVGDVGIGFPHWRHKLANLAEACEETGKRVFMIRGNHDDPAPFRDRYSVGRSKEVQLVADYSTLLVNSKGKAHHILMAGGAISLDRVRRKVYEATHQNGKVYWPDEAFGTSGMTRELAAHPQQIQHIITHTGLPEWCRKTRGSTLIDILSAEDPDLLADLEEERRLLAHFNDSLLIEQHPVKTWHFGHFHVNTSKMVQGIKRVCVGTKSIVKLL